MKADNQLAIKTYEMRLGLVPSFQGTYVTVGAYMKLEPPWRAPLFTRCSIEFPCLKTVLIIVMPSLNSISLANILLIRARCSVCLEMS